jgi:DNA-binding NarL/FixJ family response regulator
MPRRTALLSASLTIILVDDHPLAPSEVVLRIRAQPEFRLLATSAEVEPVLKLVRELRPDLVLLNLAQERSGTLTLAGALHMMVPESRVIVMGLRMEHLDLTGFIRAGVSGFIMANASFAEYLSTIHTVAAGVQVLPLALTRVLFGQLARMASAHPHRRQPDTRQLSQREREVVRLIVEGASNKEIAARLQIAVHTAKNHVHKVLSKLALGSRLEVAAFSQRTAAQSAGPSEPLEAGLPG